MVCVSIPSFHSSLDLVPTSLSPHDLPVNAQRPLGIRTARVRTQGLKKLLCGGKHRPEHVSLRGAVALSTSYHLVLRADYLSVVDISGGTPSSGAPLPLGMSRHCY